MPDCSLAVGDDGIALVTFDAPSRSVNTLSATALTELSAIIDRVTQDPAIHGAILHSTKPSGFCVGADLIEMEEDLATWRSASGQDTLRVGVAAAGRLSTHLRAIERCPKPIAAAIAGPALGGGLELALACRLRVAAAGPTLRLALPETSIGLMPGGGATQRLPRIMGIAAALPHLLDGLPIEAEQALTTGVLNEIVEAENLLDACRARLSLAPDAAAWDSKGFILPGGGPNSAAGYRQFPLAVARLAGDRGTAYPGHANTLRAVYEGSQVPIDAGLRIETRYFFNTAREPAAAAMVRTLSQIRRAHACDDGTRAEGLADALQQAWSEAAAALVAGGVPPRVVSGVARQLGWPVTLASTQTLHLEAPAKHVLNDVAAALLKAAAKAAEAWQTSTGLDAALINLAALDAGFPAWTGGPLDLADFSAGEWPIRKSELSA